MPDKKEDTQGADSSSKDGRWARWGRQGYDKSIKVSDWISPYANAISAKVGGERFWPQSHDMPLEIEKCERILRAFTVEGIVQKDSKEEQVQDGKGNWMKKKVRVMRKIPPAAIRNAKGICIFSSMRSGFAPFGGGGGSGVFMARLPDGSWRAGSAIGLPPRLFVSRVAVVSAASVRIASVSGYDDAPEAASVNRKIPARLLGRTRAGPWGCARRPRPGWDGRSAPVRARRGARGRRPAAA